LRRNLNGFGKAVEVDIATETQLRALPMRSFDFESETQDLQTRGV
jgi:hypothetical protein